MKQEFGQYEMVLEVIEDHDDKDMLNDFHNMFNVGENVSKKDFFDFCENYIDDISEKRYIHRNWRYIVE